MSGLNVNGPLRLGGSSGTSTSVMKGGANAGYQEGDDLIDAHWRAVPPLTRTQVPDAYSVVLLLGQSNMQGPISAGGYEPNRQGVDAADPHVLELSANNTNVEGYRPAPAGELQLLRNPSQAAAAGSKLCPSLPLAKRLRALRPDLGKLVIINRAEGGTHFSDNSSSAWNPGTGTGDWNPGDTKYDAVKAEVNAFMAAHPHARIVAICWHQGETDSVNGLSAANYQSALTAMVADIRANFTRAADAVFVCGTMTPSFIAANTGTTAAIDAKHRDIKSFITKSDVVIMDDYTDTDPSSIAHFDKVAIRFMGQAMADKLIPLMDTNVAPRVHPVWMQYDAAQGAFRDRYGSDCRIFGASYVLDPRYIGALSIGSSTGHNTDIPLNAAAYTKVIRVKFTTPTSGLTGADYQLLSGAVPAEEIDGGTAATDLIGTWWSTRTHTHQYLRGSFTGSGIGALIANDTWVTLALTYDSSQAIASRFKEYYNGASAGSYGATTSNGDDDDGGTQLPSNNQIIQVGCYGSTSMAAAWTGRVAAIITLPYAASAAEIQDIHEALEADQRALDPVTDLGVNPVRDWKSLLTPGGYRLVLNGGTPNLPSEKDLPWNAATYAGVATGPNLYYLRVEHAGSSYGYVTARAFATSPDTSDIIMREYRCVVISNASYTNNWTRVSEWAETTNYFDDSDGSIRRITFATGTPSYPQA